MKKLLVIILLWCSVSYAGLVFDGSSDYFTLSDDTKLDLPGGDWSFSVWVKLDSCSGSGSHIIAARDAEGQAYLDPGMVWDFQGSSSGTPNKLRFNFGSTSSARYLTSSSSPGTNREWQNIIVVRSGINATMYVANSSVATLATLNGFGGTDCDHAMTIGAQNGGGSGWIDGTIAELAFWSGTALSSTQRDALAGLGSYADLPQFPNSTAVNAAPTWYVDGYDALDCTVGGLTVNDPVTVAVDTAVDPMGGTPAAVATPSPADAAEDVSVGGGISWAAGAGAKRYKVFFGTDSTPDEDGGASEYKTQQPELSYATGTIAELTTFYWRVDSVTGRATVTGTVYSFTTGEAPAAGGGIMSPSIFGGSVVK